MNLSSKFENEDELKLEQTYDKLLEKRVNQFSLVDLQLNGYEIHFTRNGMSCLVELNDELRKALGNSIGEFRTMDHIRATRDSIIVTLSNGNHNREVTIKTENPRERLYELLKDFNGAEQIKNGKFGTIRTDRTYKYEDKTIELVQVAKSNKYQLKIGDKYYNFENHGSMKTNSGEYYIYLSSEAFGDMDQIHRIIVRSDNDPLFDGSKTFIGQDGPMHYYSTPAGIFEQD